MSLLDDAITVQAVGAKITTSGSSANVAIPVDSAANNPRYIRIAASAAACVKLGKDNTVAATTNDTQVQPGDAIIMSTNGMTYIAAIQVSAAGQVQISPLENV